MSSIFFDKRGHLIFAIKDNFNFKQCTISHNKKNVFRGIHINNFEKLVTCIQGKILDIIIDLNESSPDYLIPKYTILDHTTETYQILVPANFGHAFLTLEDNSIIIYHFTDFFEAEQTKHIHYLDPFININLPIHNKDMIISDKDDIKNFIKPIDYIIFGPNGFLGSFIVKIMKQQHKSFITSKLRLSDIENIKKLINTYSPKYIIDCVGLCGNPNIFWCDINKIETIETNITYQLTLASFCREKNIHLTIFGSGGIFKNDLIYKEEDIGNNYSNFYGECKIYLENIIKNYDNILYLRINYPICNKKHNKNLLTKLLNYKNIDDCEISITYIDDLFPILLKMIENNEIGICNFTNPGYINLVGILKKYKQIKNIEEFVTINPNFNVNETNRSLPKLECNKLLKYNPLNINDAIEKCIINYT